MELEQFERKIYIYVFDDAFKKVFCYVIFVLIFHDFIKFLPRFYNVFTTFHMFFSFFSFVSILYSFVIPNQKINVSIQSS